METAGDAKEPATSASLPQDRNQMSQPSPPLLLTPTDSSTDAPAAVALVSPLEALPIDVLREMCTYIPMRPRLRVLSLVSRRLRHVVIRSAERIPPGAPAIAYKVLQYATVVANAFVLPLPPARLPSTVRTVWIKAISTRNSSEVRSKLLVGC